MDVKQLNKLREHCTECQICCHKTLNRAVDVLSVQKVQAEHLARYVKELVVMEKLCEYICNLVCNSEKVSGYALKEYNYKCEELANICDKLKLFLDRETFKYIRCDTIMKLCKKQKKSKKTKKK